MGYKLYNNICAYIQLPNVEEEKTEKKYCCSNTDCINHKKNLSVSVKFCSQCGGKIDYVVKKETKMCVPDYYNFAEENKLDPDRFCQVQNNRQILISNKLFGSVLSWENEDEIVNEITCEEIIREIEKFTEMAQCFIDKFKEVYGIELKVKFGIVSYSM